MSIEELRDRLQKNVKGVHIELLTDSEIAAVGELLDGPAYDINRIVSGSLDGAFPERSVTCLVAPEGVFKSSLMAITCASAQQRGYTPVVIDTEGAFNVEFCERWGIDTSNMIYIYTIFVEKITTLLGDLIAGGDRKLFIILDSLGALESEKIIKDTTTGDKQAKADQGGLARKIKRMLKMYVSIVKAQNGVGMFSGHWYGKPDSYGSAEEIGGGKYVRLAADIILAMKKTPKLLDPNAAYKDRQVIGSDINICALKNRYCPPFQEATVEIDYKNGINKYAGLMDIALTCGIVEKSGTWYKFEGANIGQGMVKATQWLSENPDKVLPAIEEILKTTGYSTLNKDVEEAVKLAEAISKDTPSATKGKGKKK
jgi:recombination protein RecA